MTGKRVEPDLLDTADAARMLHVDRATVWRYVNSGRLVPDARFSRGLAFRPETIAAYIARMSAGGRTAYLRRVEEERQSRD